MVTKLMKITNSIELLDWFKSAVDIETDYMCAQFTGMTRQGISKIRNGKTDFSDTFSLKLLTIGGHPEPLKALALLEANKAESKGDENTAKIWRHHAA